MISYNVITQEGIPMIVGSYGIGDQKTFTVKFSQEFMDTLNSLRRRLDGVTTMTDAMAIILELETQLTTIPTDDYSAISYGFVVKSNKTGNYHLHLSGTTIDNIDLPPQFVIDLAFAHEKGLDTLPMVKFMVLFLRRALIEQDRFGMSPSMWMLLNYNYISKTFVDPELFNQYKEQGYSEAISMEKARIRQTPFTNEGLLVMKKVVQPVDSMYKFVWDAQEGCVKAVLRSEIQVQVNELTGEASFIDTRNAEDLIFEPILMRNRGDAFFCGGVDGHIIKVGQSIYHNSWDKVDCNPYHSCVKGLHVGNQDYIRSFETEESVTLNCLVNPMNIGSVAYHQSEDVMRVKEYFPTSIKGQLEKNRYFYHPSTYAAKSSEAWADTLNELVQKLNDDFLAEKQKINKMMSGFNALS